MRKFVHLHVHTEYSLLDGATKIGELFQQCEKLNMPAVAITDHGNMFGAFKFVKAAVAHTDKNAAVFDFLKNKTPFKVKPIVGCELYVTEDRTVKSAVDGRMPKYNHLVLLCKNRTGYKNLIKLVSLGYTEGMYYKPRIDFALLKQYAEGLICLSACLAGELPQALLKGDTEGADRVVKRYKALFGDDYYIELQNHEIREQTYILPYLIDIARKNKVKLAATNDVHYLKKKDSAMQKVLQCISFRTTLLPDEEGAGATEMADESSGDGGYFPTKEFYLKSGDEMFALFQDVGDCLANTLEIADKCECDFFSKEPLMPLFQVKDELPGVLASDRAAAYIRKLTLEGLETRYPLPLSDEITERAAYELETIISLGFADYFLIVMEFIYWAEQNGVPVGPGRGSGAGSIVAYALGITKIDPLKYQLFFERFLNRERVSNPDFDIDFCVDGRERVIQHVVDEYGVPNVTQIITFGTMAAKAAVKDVGRVYNVPFSEVNKITKLMPGMMGKNRIGHLLGLQQSKKEDENPVIPELVELYKNDDTVRRVLDMAMQVEGMPRQSGIHAAGVIICRDPVAEHIPLSRSSEGLITTEFDMTECEELGLLKMDFLGLRTVTDIENAKTLIRKLHGVELDFYKEPLSSCDDPETYAMIGEGDTHAVFQLESEGFKKFMRELKPTTLEEIIAGIALYRPGPMAKIGDFIRNKKHPERTVYDHPLLEPILNVTFGIMVYQEQVMQATQRLAGYSLGRADIMRRNMSKKKTDEMEKERAVFIHGGKNDDGSEVPGCVKNGVPEAVANKIFNDMMAFASYAFNKSHAAAYAALTYQTAYLKRHYPVEFITAVLNNRITSIDELSNYLSYLKQRGIQVLPPDINHSVAQFSVDNGSVRTGMAAIKNVGQAAIEAIVHERTQNGKFTDFVSFVKRMSAATLNKKQLESLIFAGTFDCFGRGRALLINVYEQIFDRVNKDKKAKDAGQYSFFDLMADDFDAFEYPDNVKEYDLSERLKREKEVAGVYLTGHPLDQYAAAFKDLPFTTAMLKPDENGVCEVSDDQTITLSGIIVEAGRRFAKKTGREFYVGRIEDLYGSAELMLAGNAVARYKDLFVPDKIVTVSGRVRLRDEEEASISINSIRPVDAGAAAVPRKICVYIAFDKLPDADFRAIQDIFRAYPGADECFLKDTDENKIYPLKIPTEINDMLVKELSGIVGLDNIKII